jgi:hypothetical protein
MIISAIEVIIAKCVPKKMTMQSYHRNLPDKAMKKYTKIADNMKKWGYIIAVDTRDGTTGIHYWLFVKNENVN